MRWLILPLLIAGVISASPTIWGPAGMPDEWDILEMDVDSLRALVIDADSTHTGALTTDSAATVTLATDIVTIGTGSASDIDVILRFNDGANRDIKWDDGTNTWSLSGKLQVIGSYAQVTSGNQYVQLYPVGIYTDADVDEFRIDIDLTGQGNLILGQSGDSDSLFSECVYNEFDGSVITDTLKIDSMVGFVREVTSNYTVTMTDWQIVVKDALNITLPPLSSAYDSLSALTGDGFQVDIKLVVNEACTVSCAGADSLDGDVEFVFSAQWENVGLRATNDRWITR